MMAMSCAGYRLPSFPPEMAEAKNRPVGRGGVGGTARVGRGSAVGTETARGVEEGMISENGVSVGDSAFAGVQALVRSRPRRGRRNNGWFLKISARLTVSHLPRLS